MNYTMIQVQEQVLPCTLVSTVSGEVQRLVVRCEGQADIILAEFPTGMPSKFRDFTLFKLEVVLPPKLRSSGDDITPPSRQ